jgi:hypothetical protein
MYFELVQGEPSPDATPQAIAAQVGRSSTALAGAWQATAGAGLPRLVMLHRWAKLDDRDAALASGRHVLATDVLLRHEVAVLGASSAWAAVRRETALPADVVHELRIQQVLNGHGTEAAKVMGESTLPLLQALGAQVLGVFDLLLGAQRPRLATFLAWPTLAAQQQAWARLDVEPRVWRRRDEERTRLRRRLFGAEQCHLLAALPGCAPQANFGVAP